MASFKKKHCEDNVAKAIEFLNSLVRQLKRTAIDIDPAESPDR